MPIDTLRSLLEEQTQLLSNDCVFSCMNRRGLRQTIAQLLEVAFLDLASYLAPTVSIEIGAHEASFSERLKARCANLHALAFEANPHIFGEHVARLRHSSVGVDYHHAAVCDQIGSVELQIPIDAHGTPVDPGISSVLRRSDLGVNYETVQVPALTLDAATRHVDTNNSVAWIDAEGAQYQIIAAGRDYLKRVAALYIELERVNVWRGQKIDSEITSLLADFSLEPVMRDDIAKSQYNAVFIRRTSSIIDAATPIIKGYLAQLQAAIVSAGPR